MDKLVELEEIGLDAVSVAELYSFDAVSRLGYLAARTSRLHIESGIVQIYARTPSLTAMTAAGLDYVSDGRFVLGMGASGPQVIEGFHGIRYDAPLGRTREIVDICRQVWRREKLEHHGKHYTIPLPADEGTGLGKPLKLINHPVRDRIPVMLAALGPKNVALTAEIAENLGADLVPPRPRVRRVGRRPGRGEGQAGSVARRPAGLGVRAVRGRTRRGHAARARPPAARPLHRRDGREGPELLHQARGTLRLRAEAAHDIQDLYLAGRKDEAAEKVPEELVHAVSLIGTEDEVAAQAREFAAAGVTQLNIQPLDPDHDRVKASLETLKSLL